LISTNGSSEYDDYVLGDIDFVYGTFELERRKFSGLLKVGCDRFSLEVANEGLKRVRVSVKLSLWARAGDRLLTIDRNLLHLDPTDSSLAVLLSASIVGK